MLEFDQKRKYEELPVLSSLLIVLCCLLSKASKKLNRHVSNKRKQEIDQKITTGLNVNFYRSFRLARVD